MRAFTLIELIFVIVITGLLMFVGLEYIPDDTLNNDKKALKNLIFLKETNALGYEADMSDDNDKKKVCITFTKNYINSEENSSKIRYYIKSDITADYNTVCFDKFGRVFNEEIDDNNNNLLQKNVNIMLSYKGSETNITINKTTGYISENN